MDRGGLSRPGLARREGGRAGQRSWHPSRGRRLRVMAWKRGQPARQLAWVKVLERALPLQAMRQRVSPSEDRLLLMPSDLRIWRRQHRRPLTTIFLVDASGSMAATRLAEAKGAVQALLAECYVRRDQVDQLLEKNWVDSFRQVHQDTVGAYSWWSQRFPSVRLQNKGWRIDYLCTTKAMASKIKDAFILPEVKHSDHCPIVLELKK